MSNLLSHEIQKQIATEYKRRRMIVILISCTVTIFVSAGFLLPSYLLSTIKLEEVKNTSIQARVAVEDLQKTKSSANQLLSGAEKQLALIGTNNNKLKPSDVIRLVTDGRGVSVRIQSITFETGGENLLGKIIVMGIAKDRDSLTDFVKQLQSQPLFSVVDLPVSNLAKDKDISFSINIQGNF